MHLPSLWWSGDEGPALESYNKVGGGARLRAVAPASLAEPQVFTVGVQMLSYWEKDWRIRELRSPIPRKRFNKNPLRSDGAVVMCFSPYPILGAGILDRIHLGSVGLYTRSFHTLDWASVATARPHASPPALSVYIGAVYVWYTGAEMGETRHACVATSRYAAGQHSFVVWVLWSISLSRLEPPLAAPNTTTSAGIDPGKRME